MISLLARVLVEALLYTLGISLFGMILATVVGLFLGIAAYVSRFFHAIMRGCFLVVRGLPLLLVLFLFYFGAQFSGFPLASALCGVLGISLYIGLQVAEVVLAGLRAISPSQVEAGIALGYDRFSVMMEFILPQALRAALPAYLNLLPVTLRASALVSIIGTPDLALAARELSVAYHGSIWVWAAVMGLYFLITYPLVRLADRLNCRLLKAGAHPNG